MSLYGWKQLILWSIEHSCLSESERERIVHEWELLWKQFLNEVEEEYDMDDEREG